MQAVDPHPSCALLKCAVMHGHRSSSVAAQSHSTMVAHRLVSRWSVFPMQTGRSRRGPPGMWSSV